MSKPINKLLPVRSIEGSIIYTKDNRSLFISQLKSFSPFESSTLFENIISSLEVPTQVIICNKQLSFEDFKPYFQELLTQNLTSNLLPHVLNYMESFKRECVTFSGVCKYIVFQINDSDDIQEIVMLFKKHNINISPLERSEIINLFETICLQ